MLKLKDRKKLCVFEWKSGFWTSVGRRDVEDKKESVSYTHLDVYKRQNSNESNNFLHAALNCR